MALELVETVEVGAGGASSIEFTSIPQDGVDLLLKVSGRGSDSTSSANISINGDTTNANYTRLGLQGNGSSVSTFQQSFRPYISLTDSGDTANTFGSGQLYIPNYTASAAKSMSIETVEENNATATEMILWAASHTNTSPVTSLSLTANFVEGSSASLYKIS